MNAAIIAGVIMPELDIKTTRLPLSSAHNTRDLGGFMTKDGKRVRANCLLRSGELYRLSEQDSALLLSHHLKTVIDFRTEAERREKPDTVIPNVRYLTLPILEEKTLGITREKSAGGVIASFFEALEQRGQSAEQYMVQMYRSIACDKFARSQYRRFFAYLLEQEEGAVLWHCSAGKDRAGVGAALVLTALGVPRDAVISDYLMTGVFLADDIDRLLKGLPDSICRGRKAEEARALFCVKDNYINAVLEELEAGQGMDAFLENEMGLTPEKRERLKARYLE